MKPKTKPLNRNVNKSLSPNSANVSRQSSDFKHQHEPSPLEYVPEVHLLQDADDETPVVGHIQDDFQFPINSSI